MLSPLLLPLVEGVVCCRATFTGVLLLLVLPPATVLPPEPALLLVLLLLLALLGGDILAHSGRLMLAASTLDTASSAQLEEQLDTLPTDFQLDVNSSPSPLLLLEPVAAVLGVCTGPFALAAPLSDEGCLDVGFSFSPLLAAGCPRTMVAELRLLTPLRGFSELSLPPMLASSERKLESILLELEDTESGDVRGGEWKEGPALTMAESTTATDDLSSFIAELSLLIVCRPCSVTADAE